MYCNNFEHISWGGNSVVQMSIRIPFFCLWPGCTVGLWRCRMRPRAWPPLGAMLADFHLAELFCLFLRWLNYREMGISPLVDPSKKIPFLAPQKVSKYNMLPVPRSLDPIKKITFFPLGEKWVRPCNGIGPGTMHMRDRQVTTGKDENKEKNVFEKMIGNIQSIELTEGDAC